MKKEFRKGLNVLVCEVNLSSLWDFLQFLDIIG
jgi:hypothetical protein